MAGPQVLVVEDNEKNMKLFRDVLQAKGYRTLEATTGEEAVALATEHGPDLVLMDIQLPDIDGVEALARLRADERTASIPVLALTVAGDGGRPRAVPGRGLRRLRLEAGEHRQLRRHRRRALRRRSMSSENGAARILVVDDVPENVRLLEAVLAPRGYDVVVANDGHAALELAESAKPDLVLLDVVMPGLDGYAVCRQLREREETAVLPVIMLTASEGSEKTKAIEAGADDFIAKPFNHDELLARVRSLLRIKRYHDTIKELNRTLEERVRDAGRGARAVAAAPAVPLAAARRGDRLFGRRVDPVQPSPAGRDVLRRPARLDELRRRGRAGRADAGARRVPRGDRAASSGASTRRSASSRATASSSSSTTRSRSPTRRCGRCGSVARSARRWRS